MKEETFRRIYDSCYDDLCRSLSYYTRDAQAVEDVVQDVFVSLWHTDDFTRITHMKAYLLRSARNKMLNLLRDRRRRDLLLTAKGEEESRDEGLRECVEMDEFREYVRQAVDKLPEKCRDIYLLSKEEGLSYKQIAGQQGISVKTVETQMGIALKKIREEILRSYGQSILLFCIFLFGECFFQ